MSDWDQLVELAKKPSGIATFVMEFIVFIGGGFFLYKEIDNVFDVRQTFSCGFSCRKVLSKLIGVDRWILFSFLGSGLLVATPVLHLLRINEDVRKVAAVASVLLLINSLRYLRGFNSLGPLVRNVEHIITDIASFVTLLFLIVLGFSNAFNLMYAESDVNKYEHFGKSFMSTFAMMMGGFELAEFANASNETLMNILFLIYMLLVNIVLLNMLIAIMGETYTRISENATSEFQYARAKLIVDNLAELPKDVHRMERFKWIHALQPAHADMKEEDEQSDELKRLNESLQKATQKLDHLTTVMKGT